MAKKFLILKLIFCFFSGAGFASSHGAYLPCELRATFSRHVVLDDFARISDFITQLRLALKQYEAGMIAGFEVVERMTQKWGSNTFEIAVVLPVYGSDSRVTRRDTTIRLALDKDRPVVYFWRDASKAASYSLLTENLIQSELLDAFVYSSIHKLAKLIGVDPDKIVHPPVADAPVALSYFLHKLLLRLGYDLNPNGERDFFYSHTNRVADPEATDALRLIMRAVKAGVKFDYLYENSECNGYLGFSLETKKSNICIYYTPGMPLDLGLFSSSVCTALRHQASALHLPDLDAEIAACAAERRAMGTR